MGSTVGTAQLQELRAVIDGLHVAVHGDAIREARALHDRLDAVITEAEAAYTAAGLAEVEGFANVAAFERHRCGMTVHRSRRVARRAARVAAWPELGEAWRCGRLTGDQVELVASLVPDHHVARFAETIDDTLRILGALDAAQTAAVLRHWVGAADDLAQREAAEEGIETAEVVPERELSASRVGDELAIRGHVDLDSAATVEKALTAATRDDGPDEQRTPMQRRADALLAVCDAYLASLENPDGNRRTERLTITADVVALYRAWLRAAGVVTAADLERFFASRPGLGELDRGLFLEAFDGSGGVATTLDGHPVSDALVAAVASGGTMEVLLTSGNRLLSLGRSVRAFTPAQRRSVLARDGGCRGCGAEPARCDVHHVAPWEAGGRTDVGNAVALCRRCHRMLHRRRWTDHVEPDGTYTVTLEDGTTRTTRPPGLDDRLPRLPVSTSSEPARVPRALGPPVGDRHEPPADRSDRPRRSGRSHRRRHRRPDLVIGDVHLHLTPTT